MPKVVVKCIDCKGKVCFALVFCPGIEKVVDRVITWDIRDIALLTDLRCSEIKSIKVGEELHIC